MRSHAAAVGAYRSVGKNQIGIVVNLEPKYPASDTADDRAAVQRADAYMNRQYLDPLFLGSYPPELAEILAKRGRSFRKATSISSSRSSTSSA